MRDSQSLDAGIVPDIWERLWSRLVRSWGFDFFLKCPLPDSLAIVPARLLPSDLARAEDMLYQAGHRENWQRQSAHNGMEEKGGKKNSTRNITRLRYLHVFSWLDHVSALKRAEAITETRKIVDNWINDFGRHDPFSWRCDILGMRLVSWFRNYRLLFENAELVYRSRAMVCLVRQGRYLELFARRVKSPTRRIPALLGLCYVHLCVDNDNRKLSSTVTLLISEVEKLLNTDGGHKSRNPSVHANFTFGLAALRHDLVRASKIVPSDMHRVLQSMATFLRVLQHLDGDLAGFNGGGEQGDGMAAAAITIIGSQKQIATSAPKTGYYKLQAGKTALLFDGGSPPAAQYQIESHAGALSLEISDGECRLVTNCGPSSALLGQWQESLAATAAHSTMELGGRSCARIKNGLIKKPPNVVTQSIEHETGLGLSAWHDGYLLRYRYRYFRRLFLTRDGKKITGEERLEPERKFFLRPANTVFALRFHIYPNVSLSQIENGRILLKLPNNNGWMLIADGGAISIAESVYVGSDMKIRKNRQILLSGQTDRRAIILRWSLRRI